MAFAPMASRDLASNVTPSDLISRRIPLGAFTTIYFFAVTPIRSDSGFPPAAFPIPAVGSGTATGFIMSARRSKSHSLKRWCAIAAT